MPPPRTGIAAVVLLSGCSLALDFGELDAPPADALVDGPRDAPRDGPDPADAAADAAVDAPATDAPVDGLSCDGGDVNIVDPLSGHCYAFFEAPVTWDAGNLTCGAIGFHMVTFGSAAENALLAPSLGVGDHWIGFSDIALEGSFVWVNGEDVVYTNFRLGEPNDAGGVEDCGVIEAVGAQWDDRPCATVTYGTICERD